MLGAVQAIEPLETLVDGEGTSLWGTTWTTGATHYVVLAATIALIGAVTYWAPKLLGKSLRSAPSTLLALGFLVGTIVLCLSDLVSGLLGQPSQLGAIEDNTSTIEAMNLVSAIGGGIVLLSAVGWVLLLLWALADKKRPGRRSLAGPHARVGDIVAAAGGQLRHGARDHLGGPALRLPPP